ncbi:MAG: GntR family transcriptional regulator [Planctomycetaceae bacterium]
MSVAPFARPKTTQEQVLEELRGRILTGAIRPGDPIRPDQLAAELGVSRVPVREALKILEGEGQVRYRAHHGYVLTELDLGDLREIYRARQLLEDEAARAALPRLSAEDLARMRALCDEMERLGTDDAAAMAVVNRRFHFVLLEASQMPHLLHHIRLLWNTSDHYRSEYYLDDAHRRAVHDEHRRIVHAAAADDAEALIGALDEHRDHAIEGLRTTLEETPDA